MHFSSVFVMVPVGPGPKMMQMFLAWVFGRFAIQMSHRMNHLMGMAIHALFDLKRNLISLPVLLSRTADGERMRKQVVHTTNNPRVRSFYQTEYYTYSLEAFSPLLNRFSSLFLDESAYRVFSIRQ